MKPQIEQAIAEQTGIKATINGDVHFSLLGRTTIVAHKIDVPHGEIGALMFSVPITSIFNLDNARLTGDIAVYNANFTITSLIPQNFGHPIEIRNSLVKFRDKYVEIINATMNNGQLVGVIRTQNHKYDIDFEKDHFYIHNQNDKFNLSGQLYTDGSARGKISMETENINRWFGFAYPKIEKTIKLDMNFEWDGNNAWNFTNINTGDITGNIEILADGTKNIQLRGENISTDLSFLTQPSNMYYMTKFDLDFTGNMKFGNHEFQHIKIDAVGTHDALNITNIIADDIAINGGYIDENGAHNLMITMPYNGTNAMCIFSGTPENWECAQFSYGDFTGYISVSPDAFDLNVSADIPMPDRDEIIAKLLNLAPRGRITFEFSDIGGTMDIEPDSVQPYYSFADGKTLQWLNPNISQTPQFMRGAVGDFKWQDGIMRFIPDSRRWVLDLTQTRFRIAGKNAKEWFPGIDTQAFNNLEYIVSGTYSDKNVSDLKIEIAGHEFTGTITGDSITLRTPILNIDSFISQNYLDNAEEISFLAQAPIMIPFDLPVRISLYADSLIYNGNMFRNFAYSLKPNIQTFSITDSNRGNLLATISRNGNTYAIAAQLNRFVIDGTLLSAQMPLNVRDAMITAEINMNTYGNIAHDLEYNLTGDMDLSFDGGYLVGIGVDEFFAAADKITTLNAEYALSFALNGGESAIKKMRVIGTYTNGDFKTTSPILLQLRHTDATGELEITNRLMRAQLQLTLRGTSPVPQPIELIIAPDGTRAYSLSEIMTNFDPTYMRDFVRTHDKF